MATVGAYEVPIWAKNGWLHELTTYVQGDAAYDPADLLKPMVQSLTGDDGKMYAAPFYGESSFLMYNKDLFEPKGLTMPEQPTWDAGRATSPRKLDDAQPGVAGICLRGLPGWGELFAPLTTVVNTFGGTWFDEGLDAAGERAGVHRGHPVLRRPGPQARRGRAPRRPASPSA